MKKQILVLLALVAAAGSIVSCASLRDGPDPRDRFLASAGTPASKQMLVFDGSGSEDSVDTTAQWPRHRHLWQFMAQKINDVKLSEVVLLLDLDQAGEPRGGWWSWILCVVTGRCTPPPTTPGPPGIIVKGTKLKRLGAGWFALDFRCEHYGVRPRGRLVVRTLGGEGSPGVEILRTPWRDLAPRMAPADPGEE